MNQNSYSKQCEKRGTHDLKRRLAILEEIRKIDAEEAFYKKQQIVQKSIIRNKLRRLSGKKGQRAQCRKQKRRKAIERDRKLRPLVEVVPYQMNKQRKKKSVKRYQRRKMRSNPGNS
ncbi:unnamed protein product [Allacma fusca]|uniref:Uncharacterized protein n=1 Tax=Allacma fusca TaxID=39272 RepID=A0A8J2KRF9_9HEXA|nr:unnamed protein product [Allacma fusca]